MSTSADPVWIPPKGTFHMAFSYTQAFWDQYLQRGANPINLPGEITQHEFTINAQWVPKENFSIDLQVPIVISQKKFVYIETDYSGEIYGVGLGPEGEVRDVGTNNGLGDVVLGFQKIFLDKRFSLGIRSYLKLPGTYETGEIPNAPGDGQTDLGTALLLGGYSQSLHLYLRSSLAWVFRTGVPANQFESLLEPGIHFTQAFSIRFLYQWINQLGGDDYSYYSWVNFFPSNEEDSHRIGFGLTYRPSPTVGLFGLYQQTVAGQNTSNTKAFTFGVDWLF